MFLSFLPYQIVVPTAGYLIYKTEKNEILRRDLDGNNLTLLLSREVFRVANLAVQQTSHMVYASSSYESFIACIPITGGRYKVIYESSFNFYPISMAFDESGDLVVLDDLQRYVYTVSLFRILTLPRLVIFQLLRRWTFGLYYS